MEKTIKQKIMTILRDKRLWYALCFILIFFVLFSFIQPTRAELPYELPTPDEQKFALENMSIWKKITINATVPEGDSLYENNSLGWQLLTVQYEMTKSLMLDAASQVDISPLANSHLTEFTDEFWWEGFGYDIFDNPLIMTLNTTNNIYYTRETDDSHEYLPLAGNMFQLYNFLGARKTSGYRYQGIALSPMQLGVLYCNNHGYTFHNVTDAETRFLTGFGGLRPSYMSEILSAPCEVDYNLSYMNPVLFLQPRNDTEADKITSPLMDFSSHELINFETQAENGTWINDADFGISALVLVVVAAAIPTIGWIINTITGANTQQLIAQLAIMAGLGFGFAKGAEAGYEQGYDTATDLFTIMMENELRKLAEQLNWTQQTLMAALDALSRVNGWVQGNFSNPYSSFPAFNPYYSTSQISVTIWYIVAAVVIVIVIIVIIFIIWKIRKGGKKKEEKDNSGGDQQTIIVKAASIYDSLEGVLNFGMSTGAI